mmetsp:Transcript_33025/g.98265  ORF Transcript_33025/g.98265 Transcript_33025/m.98265 type:complete len:290 (-) Transcript_33025:463-1332(-)
MSRRRHCNRRRNSSRHKSTPSDCCKFHVRNIDQLRCRSCKSPPSIQRGKNTCMLRGRFHPHSGMSARTRCSRHRPTAPRTCIRTHLPKGPSRHCNTLKYGTACTTSPAAPSPDRTASYPLRQRRWREYPRRCCPREGRCAPPLRRRTHRSQTRRSRLAPRSNWNRRLGPRSTARTLRSRAVRSVGRRRSPRRSRPRQSPPPRCGPSPRLRRERCRRRLRCRSRTGPIPIRTFRAIRATRHFCSRSRPFHRGWRRGIWSPCNRRRRSRPRDLRPWDVPSRSRRSHPPPGS